MSRISLGASLNLTDTPFINLPVDQTLLRVYSGITVVKPKIPQWFTLDPKHDFILDSIFVQGRSVATVSLHNSIKVINLQNKLIRQLLNLAIDRITLAEAAPIFNYLDTRYNKPGDLWNNETTNYDAIKKFQHLKLRLKAVYGGISFDEQFKIVHHKYIMERANKIGNFIDVMQRFNQSDGFRLSQYEYDVALCNIIVKLFSKKHKFFEDVKGWIHDQWVTPWHDKNKDMSDIFKNEVVLILENSNLLNIAPGVPVETFVSRQQPGGGKVSRIRRSRDKKLKTSTCKKQRQNKGQSDKSTNKSQR